ncbi:MAG: tRNA pseudouridine(55) synthase TruB [Candidatus Sulfotelmatobacter sp.]|jgi:tRNA pseudouridine55 synthase
MNGVIIIDKPAGWTSHDVVNRMRRILKQRSVGHLGTLDPLATGVLPLVVGNLTRLAQFYTSADKSYEGVIRFGFATNTYDADGEPAGDPRPVSLALASLQQFATAFLGIMDQVPPPFSAKKIQGVPAYKLARKKEEVTLKPVQIEIKEFEITKVEGDRAHFRARVASGTYMRSVAHEIGQRLGCGAHLESLRRTAAAEFDISQAHTLEYIEDYRTGCDSGRSFDLPKRKGSGVEESAVVWGGLFCPPLATRSTSALATPLDSRGVEDLFIHPRQLLPQFPCVTADEATAARIRSGRPVNLPELSRARQVKVFVGQRELIAIATRVAGTLFHPKIVFPLE